MKLSDLPLCRGEIRILTSWVFGVSRRSHTGYEYGLEVIRSNSGRIHISMVVVNLALSDYYFYAIILASVAPP